LAQEVLDNQQAQLQTEQMDLILFFLQLLLLVAAVALIQAAELVETD
jgi:hypothetical protein